jgi:hypothetical protein
MATLVNIRIHTQAKAVHDADYVAINKVTIEGNTIVAEGGNVRYVLGVVPMENIVVETPSNSTECGCNTTNTNIFATLIKGVDGGSGDIYITPFTVEDVASLYDGDIATLSIPTALIEAVIAKKRVLIPSEYDFGNGFAELTYAEGYIGGGDAGLCVYFFMMGYLYQIYIDNYISDGAIIANKEHVSLIRVAGANAEDVFAYLEARLSVKIQQ